jgi:pyruvate,orthophosphate dikinase
VPTAPAALSDEFAELMVWADAARKLRVRANADTPLDARTARNFGAEGIGLCRTEHMFFDGERIPVMWEMILASTREARERALDKLLPFQQTDFVGILREMKGLPVTIRLLDPPLHEFLPHESEQLERLAIETKTPLDELKKRSVELHEFNPMLGHRGVRLVITYPEITEMQTRAIRVACDRQVRDLPDRVTSLPREASSIECTSWSTGSPRTYSRAPGGRSRFSTAR